VFRRSDSGAPSLLPHKGERCPHKRGAQIIYSDLAIETALTLKVVYNLALRQTEGFLRSIIELLNLDLDVPDYSTISRRQGGLDIDLGARPSKKSVHIVVDSTGVKVYGEGEWKVRQYGYSKRRTWRKLHLGVDEETGEILAETLTTNNVDDASCVDLFLHQINRPISAFGGDGS
ncbi:MAG: IS5 family transposase, partial [bacterium]